MQNHFSWAPGTGDVAELGTPHTFKTREESRCLDVQLGAHFLRISFSTEQPGHLLGLFWFARDLICVTQKVRSLANLPCLLTSSQWCAAGLATPAHTLAGKTQSLDHTRNI